MTPASASARRSPPIRTLQLESLPGAALVFDERGGVGGWNGAAAAFFDALGARLVIGETREVVRLKLQQAAGGVPVKPFEAGPVLEEQLAWRRTWLRVQEKDQTGRLIVQWFDYSAQVARRSNSRRQSLQREVDRVSLGVGILAEDRTWILVNRVLAEQPGRPVRGDSVELLASSSPELVEAIADHGAGQAVAGRRVRWGSSWFSLHLHFGEMEGEAVVWLWLVDVTPTIHAQEIALQAEARAMQARHQMAQLLDVATDAVVGIDVGRRRARLNRRAAELVAIEPNPANGDGDGWWNLPLDQVLEQFGDESGRELLGLAETASTNGEDCAWDGLLGPAGTERRWCSIRVRRTGSNSALLIITDVDQLHRQNQELERLVDEARAAALAKERFLATMSHELRTPFAGVVSALQALAAGGGMSLAHQALDAARLLTHLLDDLLDLQRIEEGRLKLVVEPVRLETLGAQVVELIRPRAWPGVALDLTLSPEVPAWVKGDPTRIRQILFNLVGNAAKFTERGAISIEISRRPDGIAFVVADTGCGMPMDVVERILIGERFVQADQTAARRHGGSGLGLSIVRGLIDVMGGSWTIDTKIGVGTQITVELPLPETRSPRARRDPSTKQDRSIDLAGLSILLVEDDDLLRTAVDAILRQAGLSPRVVPSGLDAISALGRHRFDVVLTDLHMADVSGWDVSRVAAGLADAPTIVALTADGLAAARRDELRKAGIARALVKPVDSDVLLDTLCEIARERRGEHGAGVKAPRQPPARPPRSPAGMPALLDAAQMLNSLGGAPEPAFELALTFVPHLQEKLIELRRALDGSDRDTILRVLHTIKGLARTAGAERMSLVTADLEMLAKQARPVDAAAIADELALLAPHFEPGALKKLIKEGRRVEVENV